MHIIHHYHRLSIYPEPDFVVFKGILIGEAVEEVEAPRSEVEVVDQLNGKGGAYQEFKEVLFRRGNRPSL